MCRLWDYDCFEHGVQLLSNLLQPDGYLFIFQYSPESFKQKQDICLDNEDFKTALQLELVKAGLQDSMLKQPV